jgi:hypothetical protein
MGHHIILIVRTEPALWLKQAILQKEDLQLHRTDQYDVAFKLIAGAPCDLFVAWDMSQEPGLVAFIERLLFDLPGSPPMGILVTAQAHPGLRQKFIQTRLDAAATLEEFNMAVARALNLPVRAHRRYLIRMHLGVAGGNTNLIATLSSVNISAGGLLVESTRELPVGQTYMWSFSGAKGLEGFSIPGKILREVEEQRHGNLRRYAIQFDPAAKAQCQTIGQYLADKY